MEKKYELTIAMIVKNEEKTLEECLKGLARLRDAVNCELIITDTGSTDKTIEIAEKYADTVLNFEWCNDFSKARNTGVDASDGKWFMFVDADEIFDESILEIAKFIKSPDRDNYDNATFIQRNVNGDNRNKFNDFRAGRLFNFTKKKRPFIFTIHEAIPAEGARYQIDAVAWHSGYHKDIFDYKRTRNREILEKELESDPNNIRYMKQIIDISTDEDEKIQLATKAIDLCKSKDAKNADMVFSIYTFLARTYLSKNDFKKVIEISDDFLKIKMKDNRNLPYLEMSWMSATAALKIGDNNKALNNFLFYKSNYEYLLKNPDNVFCSSGVYTTNKQVVYHQACLQIAECLHKNNETEKAIKLMETLNCYKYKESDEYVMLNTYLKNTILLNTPHLFNKILDFINRVKIDVYSKEKHPFFMLARIHFNDSIVDFVQNSNKIVFSKLCLLMFRSCDFAPEIVFEHLNNKQKFVNLKEQEYYIDLMRLYILYTLDDIKVKEMEAQKNNEKLKIQSSMAVNGVYIENKINNAQNSDITSTKINQVNKVFELLIKNNYDLISKIENINKLKQDGLNKINATHAMTIIIYEGLKNKSNDINSYITSLKQSMPYASKHTEAVQLAIKLALENSQK